MTSCTVVLLGDLNVSSPVLGSPVFGPFLWGSLVVPCYRLIGPRCLLHFVVIAQGLRPRLQELPRPPPLLLLQPLHQPPVEPTTQRWSS